jgi:phenylacetaldehyde dehydrogenase
VQKKQFERVVAGVADTARNAVLGSGFDPATQIGPLVSQRQRENVLRFIDTGLKEGSWQVLVDFGIRLCL